MMGASVIQSPIGGNGQQFLDNNGSPLSGGKLYTYAAGTTTPLTTYSDGGGTTPNTNPIILDSGGRVASGGLWLVYGSPYKIVLKTSADVLVSTLDNILGITGVLPFINAGQYGVDPLGIADSTAALQAVLDAVPASGGIVLLPAGDFLITGTLVFNNPGIILQGQGGFGAPENYSPGARGSRIKIATTNITALRINYNGCKVRDLMLYQNGTPGTAIGIDATPGATPGTPLFQTSSYLELDGVVIKGFKVAVDSRAMNGNNGGWFHRYTRSHFVGPGLAVSGSRGIICDSNSFYAAGIQCTGFEYGIEAKYTKGFVQAELSGNATGWYSNGCSFSVHFLSLESNTANLAFNSGATNTQNTVTLQYAGGAIAAGDVPNAWGNSLYYQNRAYNVSSQGPNVEVPGFFVLTGVAGVTLQYNETLGLVASVAHTGTGLYTVTLSKTVAALGITVSVLQTNNIRAIVQQSNLTRGIGSGNSFVICVYDLSTNLTDLATASDQGLIVGLTLNSLQLFATP
jgi:hypothetical protein